jgi:hypothetical protein
MDVSGCRLACFSATGFSDALRQRAETESDVMLVGLAELYGCAPELSCTPE